jgi:hypothetical protein
MKKKKINKINKNGDSNCVSYHYYELLSNDMDNWKIWKGTKGPPQNSSYLLTPAFFPLKVIV